MLHSLIQLPKKTSCFLRKNSLYWPRQYTFSRLFQLSMFIPLRKTWVFMTRPWSWLLSWLRLILIHSASMRSLLVVNNPKVSTLSKIMSLLLVTNQSFYQQTHPVKQFKKTFRLLKLLLHTPLFTKNALFLANNWLATSMLTLRLSLMKRSTRS